MVLLSTKYAYKKSPYSWFKENSNALLTVKDSLKEKWPSGFLKYCASGEARIA